MKDQPDSPNKFQCSSESDADDPEEENIIGPSNTIQQFIELN